MRALTLLTALFILIAAPALAEDEVRLDHKGGFMGAPASSSADRDDLGTDAMSDSGNDSGNDFGGDAGGDSGSGDLAVRIERGGYATGDEADNEIGGNGPLSRDGGFNFGPAR